MKIKNLIRDLLINLHIDINKGIKYDRLTYEIIKKLLKTNSNCIDVGCHEGDILKLFMKYAPLGNHYAFEPLPHLYERLLNKYHNITILPYAISDYNGKATFQFVKNAPAYSGIRKRRYDIDNPIIEQIIVEIKTLDSIIPENQELHFIKIDVEGGEFAVLKGAIKTLSRSKPAILFEAGVGASDFYGTKPIDLYDLLCKQLGYKIYTLAAFLNNSSNLYYQEFEYLFNTAEEYYYIAVH
jgi:FkbM family methyltransferase